MSECRTLAISAEVMLGLAQGGERHFEVISCSIPPDVRIVKIATNGPVFEMLLESEQGFGPCGYGAEGECRCRRWGIINPVMRSIALELPDA